MTVTCAVSVKTHFNGPASTIVCMKLKLTWLTSSLIEQLYFLFRSTLTAPVAFTPRLLYIWLVFWLPSYAFVSLVNFLDPPLDVAQAPIHPLVTELYSHLAAWPQALSGNSNLTFIALLICEPSICHQCVHLFISR